MHTFTDGLNNSDTLYAYFQVYTQYPNCRILACAPQNAAADLIAKRLMDHVDKRDIQCSF